MQLIIISPPDAFPDEYKVVREILTSTAATFHLRKPDWSPKELSAYLNHLPGKLHHRIMVHGSPGLAEQFGLKGIHYTERQRVVDPETITKLRKDWPDRTISSSFHEIGTIGEQSAGLDYVFLSPIFDSISKKGYRAAFDHWELRAFLKGIDRQVVALGGIDENRIVEAADLGFAGVAVLGAVWQSENPKETARKLDRVCLNLTISAYR